MSMRKIIIIGTLHGRLTPRKELKQILDDLQPDQVFVEMTPNEVKKIRQSKSIRDEMIFALEWAKEREIKTDYFDRNEGELKSGVTGKELDLIKLLKKMKKIIQTYSWKELNKEAPWKTTPLVDIENKINKRFVDVKKSKEREEKMLENINNKIMTTGKIVILTGVGHLSFFEKKIPNAIFPFRE